MTETTPTTPQKDPIEAFVDSFESLIRAIVGAEMSRNGVIGKYPHEFDNKIKVARKEIIANLKAQAGE